MAEKKWLTEDKLALILGLILFGLSLLNFGGIDPLGWAVKTNVWLDASKMFSASTGAYKELSGVASLILTWVFVTAMLAFGIKALGGDPKRFMVSFSLVFFISYFCYALGHYATIAATPNQLAKFNLKWAMGLTGEAGFIVALLAGIFIGNFMPGLAAKLKDALKPEMYVKIAIVILGAELGVKSVDALGLASSVIFRGLCAIVEAYLIYWALVYYISRKYFKFSREWAAPLASGISICGVSAAIATGGAIRARPIVPIMVSSLVVVFTCVEMLILPFVAQHWMYNEPMVAGAWMGLAVKSDGGAVASGVSPPDAPYPAAKGPGPSTAPLIREGLGDHVGHHHPKDLHRRLHRHLAFVLGRFICVRMIGSAKPGERMEVHHRRTAFPPLS